MHKLIKWRNCFLLEKHSFFDVIESTNTALLKEKPPRYGCFNVFSAALQTAGRGQFGRTWYSGKKGDALLFSIGWIMPNSAPSKSTLSLCVAVGCVRFLQSLGISGLTLKWPNDLQIGEKKLGGVLLETRPISQVSSYIVAGIGINYQPNMIIDRPVISIVELLQKAPCIDVLRTQIIESLLCCLSALEWYSPAQVLAQWSGASGRIFHCYSPQQGKTSMPCFFKDKKIKKYWNGMEFSEYIEPISHD